LTLRCWDIASNRQRWRAGVHRPALWLAYSPGDRTLAASFANGVIKAWDAATGAVRYEISDSETDAWEVTFSPDDRLLASAHSDRTIKLWNAHTGEFVAALTGHANEVYGIAFSPDGRTLASASWDGTVRLWNVFTRQELFALEGHTHRVHRVAFSPDGKTLASGGQSIAGACELLLWSAVQDDNLASTPERVAGVGRSGPPGSNPP
jgi:WD40 repeat protein